MAADVLPVSRRRFRGNLRPVLRRDCHGGLGTACAKTLSWRPKNVLFENFVVMTTSVHPVLSKT